MFHNGSNYDIDLIIKQLAKDFKGRFTCSGEKIEKYITFQYLFLGKQMLIVKNL